ARLPRPARYPRGPRGALRQALREPPGRDERRDQRVRRGRAVAPVPRAGARLLDRPGRARAVSHRARGLTVNNAFTYTRPRHGPAGSHLQLARPRVLRPVRGGRPERGPRGGPPRPPAPPRTRPRRP